MAPNAPELCPGAPDGYPWWALASIDGVLNRQCVKAQLRGDDLQVRRVWLAQVNPEHCVRIMDELRQVLDWEVVLLQASGSVQACSCHQIGRRLTHSAHLHRPVCAPVPRRPSRIDAVTGPDRAHAVEDRLGCSNSSPRACLIP